MGVRSLLDGHTSQEPAEFPSIKVVMSSSSQLTDAAGRAFEVEAAAVAHRARVGGDAVAAVDARVVRRARVHRHRPHALKEDTMIRRLHQGT